MNFLIFAGSTGALALVVTIISVILGLASAVVILDHHGRAGFRIRGPLIVTGSFMSGLLFIVTLMAAFGSQSLQGDESASSTDVSGITVEDLVPLPGSDSTALAMQDGGFNVAVERDGVLVSMSVPDLQYIGAGETPTLTTTTECELSDARGFVWNIAYECTDTLVASVPR